MYKKDYLQRQFEEFGRVLSLILGSKKQKDWEEFEKELEAATLRFTTMEMGQIENLSQAQFESEVIHNKALSRNQKKMMASLLFEKLEFYMAISDTENFAGMKEKCQSLYSKLQSDSTENEFDLDVHYKLQVLKKM